MPMSFKSQQGSAPLQAGIVGCGRIGCAFDDDPRRPWVSTHAKAYTQTPGFELAALADVDMTRVERYADQYHVPGRYDDYRRMLDEAALDVVSLCTPADTHRVVCEAAIEAGIRAIFCEKPIAATVDDADAMIERCRDAGVLLMIDHQRRFDRFHRDIAEWIQSGGIGGVQQVTCYSIAGVANSGSHLFDLLRMCFGEIAWVQGVYSRNASPLADDPNVDGWVGFDSGLIATVQSLDVKQYVLFEMNVLGEKGRLRITANGLEAEYQEARPSHRFAEYRELYHTESPVDASGPHEFMLQAMAHLHDCVSKGTAPWCTGEDGRRSLDIVLAMRATAASEGQRIETPVERETATTLGNVAYV